MMIILKCNVVMLSGNDYNELRALAGDKDCVDADENTSRGGGNYPPRQHT